LFHIFYRVKPSETGFGRQAADLKARSSIAVYTMNDESTGPAASAMHENKVVALFPAPSDDPIPLSTLDLDLLAECVTASAGLLTHR
jgi:hypothetical protein